MRKQKLAVLAVSAALVSAWTISITGQQEALPPVRPKAAGTAPLVAGGPPEPIVVLASYPIIDVRPPMTLVDAARMNDYITFAALYNEAKRSGEPVGEFDTLYAIWTYSITDPIGAFYGRDIYQRLASAYPDFPEFINQYRVTDSRGQVYWPSHETRDFLLARAIEGETPRVMLADLITLPATPPLSESWKTAVPTVPALAARVAERTPRTQIAMRDRSAEASPRTRMKKNGSAHGATAAAPPPSQSEPTRSSSAAGATRRQVQAAATPSERAATSRNEQPAVTERASVAAPAAISSESSSSAPVSSSPDVTPEQVAQLATDPFVAEPPATPATADPEASRTGESAASGAAAPPAQQQPFVNRGILLLIVALMAAGLLAVIFRTPNEFASITADPNGTNYDAKAADKEKPVAPVEPIRKSADGNRARGSRG